MLSHSAASNLAFQSTLPRRERRESVVDFDGVSQFQSTLPRRERPACRARCRSIMPFQSTLPRRERRPVSRSIVPCLTFQSTLPRRERPLIFSFFSSNIPFQSTLPRRERRFPPYPCSRFRQYFNPRYREGSDTEHDVQRYDMDAISIHAPAKGATANGEEWARPCRISIHAPAKGATGGTVQEQLQSIQFQSTLPRRERRWDTEMLALELGISIHAPAKGATLCRCHGR